MDLGSEGRDFSGMDHYVGRKKRRWTRGRRELPLPGRTERKREAKEEEDNY